MSLASILLDGTILSVLLYGGVFLMIAINPRSQLHNYPPMVKAGLPPKTAGERKVLLAVGIPVFLLLIGYILYMTSLRFGGDRADYVQALAHWILVFLFQSAVDLVICDYWIFCTITPKFIIIPGTEGNPGYKDKSVHTKTIPAMALISVVMGFVASIAYFLFK